MNFLANQDPVITAAYLRTLPSIRERCTRVYELAKQGKLEYFDYNPNKEHDVVQYCLKIIQVSKLAILVIIIDHLFISVIMAQIFNL